MIDLLKETRDFRRVAEVLFIKGWAEASAGNMSLRLSSRPSDCPCSDAWKIQVPSGHDRSDRRLFSGHRQRQPHA